VTNPPPRPRGQRIRDTLRRLERDVDAWVATADDGAGSPYLVPLSFLWDGTTLLIATPAASPTGRNLRATGRVRLAIGATRDVVLIEGTAEELTMTDISADVGEAFAGKTGFDPRALTASYLYFRIRPHRLQAWREVDELADRDLMRNGRWLIPDDEDLPASSPESGHHPDGPPYELRPIGWIESPLTDRDTAPKQGDEGAPAARIVLRAELGEAAANLAVGDDVLVFTWLHQGRRDVLSVHPRGDRNRPREGVFTTRSPDRPNPIGLHLVTIVAIEGDAVTVHALEAVNGTPVIDIKPALRTIGER
jgi:tRNA-Thr(GGU) m(6)t(6)A37 methyltransferase TsaA